MANKQLARQVWILKDHGFNILHDPLDDSPCEIHWHEDGYEICKNLSHLQPFSKEHEKES